MKMTSSNKHENGSVRQWAVERTDLRLVRLREAQVESGNGGKAGRRRRLLVGWQQEASEFSVKAFGRSVGW